VHEKQVCLFDLKSRSRESSIGVWILKHSKNMVLELGESDVGEEE